MSQTEPSSTSSANSAATRRPSTTHCGASGRFPDARREHLLKSASPEFAAWWKFLTPALACAFASLRIRSRRPRGGGPGYALVGQMLQHAVTCGLLAPVRGVDTGILPTRFRFTSERRMRKVALPSRRRIIRPNKCPQAVQLQRAVLPNCERSEIIDLYHQAISGRPTTPDPTRGFGL